MSETSCEKCWSSDAAKAWEAVRSAPIEAYLIDEPHLIVSVRCCPSCSQRYLQVTTETVDWIGGEDPIDRTIVPLDAHELDTLTAANPLDNRLIEAAGAGKRSLKHDSPADGEPSTYWSTGVQVGPHD